MRDGGPVRIFTGRAVTASAGAQACGCYYECFIARNIAHGYESKYCCAQREEAGHSEKGIFAQLGSPLEKYTASTAWYPMRMRVLRLHRRICLIRFLKDTSVTTLSTAQTIWKIVVSVNPLKQRLQRTVWWWHQSRNVP